MPHKQTVRFVLAALSAALFSLPAAGQDEAQAVDEEVSVAVAVEAEPPSDPQDPTQALQDQIKQLKLEAQLRTQRLEAELAASQAENQRLQRAYQLTQQKQREELQPLELEKAQLDLEAGLAKSRRTAEHATLDAELVALQKRQALRDAELAAELAEIKAATQKLQAQGALTALQRKAELAETQHQQALLASQNDLARQEFLAQRLAAEAEQAQALAELKAADAALKRREVDRKLDDSIAEAIDYPAEPLRDGVLTISDRRIALNGPIISGTADYLTERIHYFNNADPQAPIFLVIDNCPGGSVLQGYRIVKAIESSEAPVHVVVKSFAASMAAVITTLAEHSYAYPNAIILHHQMSSITFGNISDMADQLEIMKEWEARLARPVADKMGVTPERFVELMYENNSAGDWEEFADRAVELKWVNTIVHDIREEGVRKRPAENPRSPWYSSLFAQDEHGQTYVNLPPLEPMDAYMMYNPRNFYRVDGR